MLLRDYQAACVESALADLSEGKATLAVLPTGTGKTVIFSHIADEWHRRTGKRVLVIAHREELIFQSRDKLAAVMQTEPDIEMGDFRASTGRSRPVVVSSVQTQNSGAVCECKDNGGMISADVGTLFPEYRACDQCLDGLRRRMLRFSPADFGLVIIDEAHHATAETYKRLLSFYRRNPEIRVFGVTATPDRKDEAALGQIFGSVCYEYELPDAIRDGWLVPIKQDFVQCDGLDFSRCRTTAGDLNGADLESVLVEEEALHQVVHPTIEIAGDRPTLFFAASVAHAQLMADILNRHRLGSAACIHGGTPTEERRDLLRRYASGEYQYLCGCGVFLEGFDEPRISCVAMARPTKSRALYAQAIGRGTRPILPPRAEDPETRRAEIAASNKPDVLILDFVGNSGRHKLISSADILGGRYDDAVVERAIAEAKKKGVPVDIEDELEQAERLVEEDRRREKIKSDRANYSRKSIDPFDLFDLTPRREPGWHKGRKPSDRQLATLAKFGIDNKTLVSLSFVQASQLIDAAIKRRGNGLCSFKQAKLLAKYGERTDLPFEEASKKIDAIARNGWKPITREPEIVEVPF